MLRALLKRRIKDAHSGFEGEQVFTIDFDAAHLEEHLRRGGFGESGYESVDVIGIEYIKDLDIETNEPECPKCHLVHEVPLGNEEFTRFDCDCGCCFEAKRTIVFVCAQREYRN